MPQRKPRIGILLTVGKVEAKKEELISFRRKLPLRPWAALAPKRFHIERAATKWRNPTVGVPADIAIGAYIEFRHGKSFDVDYICPEEITLERLRSNDINFLLIYDLLEAFHTDRSKVMFQRLQDVLRKADNVFPNWEFQEFVYSKLVYYSHFHQSGLPIVETFTITKEEWARQAAKQGGWKAVANGVLHEIKMRSLKSFVAKPVYGQEAKGLMIFEMHNLDKKFFQQHLHMLIVKYPGIIIQECIKDFGQEAISPELRLYFVGREYQYTCVGIPGYRIYTLKEEGRNTARPVGRKGGWFSLPPSVDLARMKQIAVKAMDSMPIISLKRAGRNVDLPRLLTRVDMGCIRNGVFDPWINEIEFVPSLYIEEHDWPIDSRMGDQMTRIARRYLGMPARQRSLAGSASALKGARKVNMSKIKKVLSARFLAKGSIKGKRGPTMGRRQTSCLSRRVLKPTKRSML